MSFAAAAAFVVLFVVHFSSAHFLVRMSAVLHPPLRKTRSDRPKRPRAKATKHYTTRTPPLLFTSRTFERSNPPTPSPPGACGYVSSQSVNLWCCEPLGGGEGGSGVAATIVNLVQEEGEGGIGSGGIFGCPRLVASVCTHLLCPVYVSRPPHLSACLFCFVFRARRARAHVLWRL